MEILQVLLSSNAQWVLFSTLLLGIASGVLGSFALLKKQSLLSDAVAHAALPGICLAFLIVGEKQMLWLIVGALCTGLLATYLIQFITSTTKLKKDTAICLVLSSFFGLGIVLLTMVTRQPSGNKSGLDQFIFGKAAAMTLSDVMTMGIMALTLIVVTTLLFKEWKITTFDPGFSKGIGLPVKSLEFIFSSFLVLTVVVGIQAVGVILMAAMLMIPSMTARYWTDSLGKMVVISGGVGAVSATSGTVLSTLGPSMPTGPLIVLTATSLFIVSFFFAPKKGIVMKKIALRQKQRVYQSSVVNKRKEAIHHDV
ncbi:metal ABC transporter permease [Mangrovibacillus cuniculi]|uniref:Manganese transport system membrane protein MntC n=1 Tax=Mangrovibacillus cuniculi TaxID=2593652 RepID=A0A7S8CAX7_9BACI|nr:metal ABC transporter permease [Mangrovibacillus cuniculi]QPC46637.1 metal ABC transporter permease [Mangrovibacillus cuniculi]